MNNEFNSISGRQLLFVSFFFPTHNNIDTRFSKWDDSIGQ
jgi:hypothetical protein